MGKRHFMSVALFVIPLWVVFFVSLLAGCGNNTSAYDPQTEYKRACADAAVLTPAKISKQLSAIVPENTNLIWENHVVGSRVLVVSWVDQNACNLYKCPPEGCEAADTCKEGKECDYRRDTYVTLAPELKVFFKGTIPHPMRIAQLLGLPPQDAVRKTCFLEIWVSPHDLFRPSPDPEISDQAAELDFPGNTYGTRFRPYSSTELVFADMDCDPEQCPACNEWGQCGFTTYENYIKNRRKYIYTADHPYPWTGLGYTYDWGNPASCVGLSEFVVNGKKAGGGGIRVGIKAVIPTAAYFDD